METESEFLLNNPPEDYISAVQFHKTVSELLLVSAWDCSVRLYNTDSNKLKLKWMNEHPLLDCLFLVRTILFMRTECLTQLLFRKNRCT